MHLKKTWFSRSMVGVQWFLQKSGIALGLNAGVSVTAEHE
jgi:hypothetical protein